ncbi:hypothetical protein ACWGJT_12135 [Streptomyces xantholiticus]|nr:hypothetical protein CGZ69_33085 [Streptomyces peucetius subsp. caesius ATCC 27952]
MIPGTAGAVALVAAVLLPTLLLGLVVALDRYEERLFSAHAARRHHAGRHSRPRGRRSAPGRGSSAPRRTAGAVPRSTAVGPPATIGSKPPAVTP